MLIIMGSKPCVFHHFCRPTLRHAHMAFLGKPRKPEAVDRGAMWHRSVIHNNRFGSDFICENLYIYSRLVYVPSSY